MKERRPNFYLLTVLFKHEHKITAFTQRGCKVWDCSWTQPISAFDKMRCYEDPERPDVPVQKVMGITHIRYFLCLSWYIYIQVHQLDFLHRPEKKQPMSPKVGTYVRSDGFCIWTWLFLPIYYKGAFTIGSDTEYFPQHHTWVVHIQYTQSSIHSIDGSMLSSV